MQHSATPERSPLSPFHMQKSMSHALTTISKAVAALRETGHERLGDELASVALELRSPDDPKPPLYLVLDDMGCLGMGIGEVVLRVPAPKLAGGRAFIAIVDHDTSRGPPLNARELVGDRPGAGNRLRGQLRDFSRWLEDELSAEAAAEVVAPHVLIAKDGTVRHRPSRPVVTAKLFAGCLAHL